MIWKVERVAVVTITKIGHQFLKGKNRLTPSVTAPGDTNLSDATVSVASLGERTDPGDTIQGVTPK